MTTNTGTGTVRNLKMELVHTLNGHTGRIFSLAICCMPDGRRWAASASHDRTVRIWCINSNQHLRTIEYTDFVWRVFVVKIPQPVVVAFISAEGKIQVSDLETGETLSTFYGRLIFSGNTAIFPQPIIITAEGEEDVCFIDILTGDKLKTIRGGFDKMFRAVVTTGPDPLLVFTTWNTQTRRSTIQTYELLEDTDDPYFSVDNSDDEDGTLIKSPGSPGGRSDSSSITTHSSKEKMTLMFEGDSRDGVTSLVITQGSKPKICSGHYDFMVRLWSIESKTLLMVLEGHLDYVGAVACWKGNLPVVVSGSSDGTIRAWNTETGELLATGDGHTRDAWALGVTNEPNARIVSGSFDRTVKVWDLQPVLMNLNWQRRKDFCMFLSMLGFCHSYVQGENGAVVGKGCFSSQEEVAKEQVFCSSPLYRSIASYL